MTDKLREMMNDGLEAACDLQNWIENNVDDATFEKVPVEVWGRITRAVSLNRAALAAEPQPGPETMAWGVVGKDGEVHPQSIGNPHYGVKDHRGERVVLLAIRVVEGGDDAA